MQRLLKGNKLFIVKLIVVFGILQCFAFTPFSALAKRPKPPNTGTPSGNTTPGTTRPEASCPKTSKPLTALVANQGKDFTLAEYPTFFFYIPYTPQQISSIEFLLLNKTHTQTVYHGSIELKDKSGIIKIQIPPEVSNSLAVNNIYHWRMNLDCQPDNSIAADLVLQGWIRRVAPNSELENQLNNASFPAYLVYQEHEIWYDAIASLGELHFANPLDNRITEAWIDTLKSLKLDWIINEPLVNSDLKAIEL